MFCRERVFKLQIDQTAIEPEIQSDGSEGTDSSSKVMYSLDVEVG